MQVTINNRDFEWNDEKAKLNKIKHGVSFKVAAKVFADENRIEIHDDTHSQDEDRWQVIGKVEDILFVVYTERGDITRLISARKANYYERCEYYDCEEDY